LDDTEVGHLVAEAEEMKSQARIAQRSADQIRREVLEIHHRVADIHARAAEFFTNHAIVDRMAGRLDLAAEMEARAERERDLEAVERQLAIGATPHPRGRHDKQREEKTRQTPNREGDIQRDA
jgi:hypothetical protein